MGGMFAAERIFFLDEVDSTNAWILRQAETEGLCCIANHQVAGKGRQGRKWKDGKGGSILMSMGWQMDTEHASGVSLVAGLAAIRSLQESGIEGVQLKWPNDILFDGKKLGGILVEKTGSKIVVGLGMNFHLKESLALGIEQPWTDICSLGVPCDANQLLAAILRNMGEMVTDCLIRGFSGYMNHWNSLDAFRGCLTEVRMNKQILVGVEQGVDESGALRIQTDEGLKSVYSGDVSLRRKQLQSG